MTLICKSAASRRDVEKLRCGGLSIFNCWGFAKVADAVPDFGTDEGSAGRAQVIRQTNEELRTIKPVPIEGFDVGAILSIARRFVEIRNGEGAMRATV
ncbi:hypothetical protein AgCh_029382 [Apium graveolens]